MAVVGLRSLRGGAITSGGATCVAGRGRGSVTSRTLAGRSTTRGSRSPDSGPAWRSHARRQWREPGDALLADPDLPIPVLHAGQALGGNGLEAGAALLADLNLPIPVLHGGQTLGGNGLEASAALLPDLNLPIPVLHGSQTLGGNGLEAGAALLPDLNLPIPVLHGSQTLGGN